MKTVLDVINSLTTLGIVGFLIYFFIYYRKPMRSVLNTIGDADSLKAGPLEFKRRQRLDERVKTIKSEPKSDTLSEKVLLDFKKQFVYLSNFALISPEEIDSTDTEMIEAIKHNRDRLLKNISLSDSNFFSELSEESAEVDSFVDKKLQQSKP